jgi:hypothetical protein
MTRRGDRSRKLAHRLSSDKSFSSIHLLTSLERRSWGTRTEGLLLALLMVPRIGFKLDTLVETERP